MIRPLLLASLLLPSLALASAAPCDTPALAPLPASVPAPEMQRAPTSASCLRLDAVAFLERLRQPAPVAAPAAAPNAAQGYVPKTQHDNTPWRFDMNQNGRRMTAAEFDAWMKAKGIRVATGKPGAATATASAAPAAAAPAAGPAQGCTPSATVTC